MIKSLEKSVLQRHTKSITTIGPSSESPQLMRALFDNGATCIRLNFSHGSYEEHGPRIITCRQIAQEINRPISVMLDTKGPEIRTGNFVNGAIILEKNATVIIDVTQPFLGTNQKFYIDFSALPEDIKIGSLILLDDGKLRLQVNEIHGKQITCKVLNTHRIRDHRGVNLPGTHISMPFLSIRDKNDLEYGCKMKVDYVAASFVRSATDIKTIRKFLNAHGGSQIKIIAKIECQQAVHKYKEIARISDAIMIARGDLGIEVPYEMVPALEKEFIKQGIFLKKPVIVATQMLESMTSNPCPTRAEVTDVFWATDLGANATMLSGESANGAYPIEAINAMTKIILQAEHSSSNRYLKETILHYLKGKLKTLAQLSLVNKVKMVIIINPSYTQINELAAICLPITIIVVTTSLVNWSMYGIHRSVKTFYFPEIDKITRAHLNIFLSRADIEITPIQKIRIMDAHYGLHKL